MWSGLEIVFRRIFPCKFPFLRRHIMAVLSLASRYKICSNSHWLRKEGEMWAGTNHAGRYSLSQLLPWQQAELMLLQPSQKNNIVQQHSWRGHQLSPAPVKLQSIDSTNMVWVIFIPLSLKGDCWCFFFPILGRSRGSSSFVIREACVSKGWTLPKRKTYWGKNMNSLEVQKTMLSELSLFTIKLLSLHRAHHVGQQGITSLCFPLYLFPVVLTVSKRETPLSPPCFVQVSAIQCSFCPSDRWGDLQIEPSTDRTTSHSLSTLFSLCGHGLKFTVSV